MSEPNNYLRLPRRHFLRLAGGGLGALAWDWLIARECQAFAKDGSRQEVNPLAAKVGHLAGKAKAVIFLFMVGGPSNIDLFDPKPALKQLQGTSLPESFGKPVSQFTNGKTPLLASTRTFRKHGRSGMPVSDLMPNLATRVDDMAFLRSCWCASTIHAPAMYELHSGRTIMGYPSLGAWVAYGLGSVSDNLPAYCVMLQPEGTPEGGAPCWGPGFLPPVYQGTLFRKGTSPIMNLSPPQAMSLDRQRRALDLMQRWNSQSPAAPEPDWQARMASYELAFRMQSHAPEAVDLSKETKQTRVLYGLDDARTTDFGTRCLLARRLVERGVRFVHLYSGGGPLVTQWDAHDDLNGNHEKMCGHVDRPIAGLLTDLKQRGLLDSTLVVWASEFGRTPMSQGGKGRDHNPYGYTMWMAGGGVRGGCEHGETDEVGLHAIKDRVSVNDFHATMLHLVGLDHEKLTYPHSGRDERLTDVAGRVVETILG